MPGNKVIIRIAISDRASPLRHLQLAREHFSVGSVQKRWELPRSRQQGGRHVAPIR
jgi:hypothetical protein